MSYQTVINEVKQYLNRSDLDDMLPIFISYAEESFNSALRHEKMMSYLRFNLVNGVFTLPSDFLEVKWLRNTATNEILEITSINQIKSQAPVDDEIKYFAIDNGNISSYQLKGNVEGFYYAKIPALTNQNPSNWLDSLRHSLYVFETAAHACLYIRDNDGYALYRDKAAELLAQVIKDDNKDKKVSALLNTELPLNKEWSYR